MILAQWLKKGIPSCDDLQFAGFNPHRFTLIARESRGLKEIILQNNFDTLYETMITSTELVYDCYYQHKFVECTILDADFKIILKYGFVTEFKFPRYQFQEFIKEAQIVKMREYKIELVRRQQRHSDNAMLRELGYQILASEEV